MSERLKDILIALKSLPNKNKLEMAFIKRLEDELNAKELLAEAIFKMDFDLIYKCDFCNVENVDLYLQKIGEPYCYCKKCAIESILDDDDFEGIEINKGD